MGAMDGVNIGERDRKLNLEDRNMGIKWSNYRVKFGIEDAFKQEWLFMFREG